MTCIGVVAGRQCRASRLPEWAGLMLLLWPITATATL